MVRNSCSSNSCREAECATRTGLVDDCLCDTTRRDKIQHVAKALATVPGTKLDNNEEQQKSCAIRVFSVTLWSFIKIT